MHVNPSEPPGGDLAEALTQRLGREADVVAAYLFNPGGTVGEVDELNGAAPVGVAVLLDQEPEDEARELELRAAVDELTGARGAEVLVLNEASAQQAYRALTDARVLLCRDEQARLVHQAETIERYFELGSLRRMLANGLRHRLGSGGPDRP